MTSLVGQGGVGRGIPRPVPGHRFTSLDGLRGVAALVVVFHHALLTVPTLASAYYPGSADIATGSLAWFFTYSPLHLLWAGTESVCLFFVLSGIVLVLPIMRGSRFSWLAYYPKRIIRLYGPVIAAVVLALVSISLVQRYNADDLSTWLNRRPNTYSGESFLRDVTLVHGASGVVSPLWSLRWEVLFSLALPLYVIFARARVPLWLKLATVFALMIWSLNGDGQYLYYLPMFAIGAVFVAHWDSLARLARRADHRRGAWPAILVVAVLLTCSRWELIGLGMSEAKVADYLWISVVGVSVLVLAAAFYPPLSSTLQRPVIQWLGAVSFSLYLVHEPIVIAMRFLTVEHPPWIGMALSIPISLALAALFARFVERPLQQLARRTGKQLEAARPN